jgi:hypothetical protein
VPDVICDKPVVEHDLLPHAELLSEPFEPEAVALAVVAHQVRVRGAEDEINRVGKLFENRRHRADHVLDALVRRQQAECQQHLLAFNLELILVEIRVDERHVGDAVVDDVDFLRRHFVDLFEKLAPPLRHDDQPRRQRGKLPHDAPLVLIRLAEHRVQGRDGRHPQLAQ